MILSCEIVLIWRLIMITACLPVMINKSLMTSLFLSSSQDE